MAWLYNISDFVGLPFLDNLKIATIIYGRYMFLTTSVTSPQINVLCIDLCINLFTLVKKTHQDELVWGAAWLLRATNDVTYLNFLKSMGAGDSPDIFSWDNKFAGAYVLLSRVKFHAIPII